MHFRKPTCAAVATLVALGALVHGGASAGGAPRSPADGKDPLLVAAQAYRKSYPQMSEEAARAAAAQQDQRKALYEELTRNGDAGFGGAWFDPPSGVLHVAVTNDDTAAQLAALGKRLDVKVESLRVQRSFAELQSLADSIRGGKDVLAEAARGRVGIDVRTNGVVVAVEAAQQGALASAAASAGVTVVANRESRTEEDAGCVDRRSCDWTIRAGSALWRGADGHVCSTGFTGRDAGGQRYVLTAGHCSTGGGVQWGTGGQQIGPLTVAGTWGSLDAALIAVTNPWFTGDLGGEIYNRYAPNKSVPLNGVAPNLGYIWSGEVVCLAANFAEPDGDSFCGTIGTNSDPWESGLAKVDNVDACGGDSGGGWYWLTSTGRRIGYGLHSRSSTGCHNHAGSASWFSPLPVVKSWAPWLDVEVV
ncbi:hypothetical protein FKR81_12865 [Lentzea tibetensis]|uniref:Streptogrisin C n=1 Tax=Lentzea tibetensis TaxID=2591470 RepID=A0A563EW97_9PSEU|nr:hypothetical protein [Lentzea tibetensis]TWP51751.1 hypothetical protein FKR81_12865 [Lentzea tibetensis]